MPRLFCSGPLAPPPPTQYRPWSLLLFSLSACFPPSLSLMLSPISFFLCLRVRPQPLRVWLPVSLFPTQTHAPLAVLPARASNHWSPPPLLFSHSVVSILLMSPLSPPLSASSPLFPPRSSPSLCLSVRSILSRSLTAGRSSLRPAPSRTFHRGQHSTMRAGERLSLKISSFPRSTRLGAGGRGVFGRAWLGFSVIIHVR